MKLFRKIKGKLGFTLAEMLIVVAILAILTAVAAPNVAKYSRSINLRELNDSARAIYMAAEHKFMNEIEMGRTLPDGAAVNTNALEKRYGGDASAVNVKYLKSESTDLQKLMTSGSAAGDSTGVIESQLYDNNYIVEYNPETGDVFGVFYSEDEDLSSYGDDCYPYIDELQKEHLIGYYGSKNVKPEEKTNSEVLPKPEVEIINKEKLVVKINTESTENQYVTISVNGKEIIKRNNTYMNGSVEIILDSLTPGTPGKANLPSENGQLQPKYEDTIANWLNETGLTIDGSDMTLTVTFYDKDGKTRDQSVTKTFNPLFANGSTADTAYIEYGRHLQNLDKCEAIHNVIIKKTIDFKKSDNSKEYEHWHDVYGDRQFTPITNDNIVSVKGEAGVEIRYLNCSSVQNVEESYTDVQSCLFNNFSGTSVKDLTFYCPTLEALNPCKGTDDENDYSCFAGVITGYANSTNAIKIENVKVINPDIESDECSGGIVGQSVSQIEFYNCSVYVEVGETAPNWDDPEKDPYSEYKIHGQNYGGGIAGTVSTSNFTKCYASVKVSGQAAGGLVGNISAGSQTSKVTSCFVGGHTYEGKFKGTATIGGVEKQFNLTDNVSGKTASGLIGEVLGRFVFGSADVEIENSFATCSVSGTNVDPLYQIGDNNGYKAKVDIKGDNVYTLGTAYKDNGDGTFTEIKKSADANVKTGDEVKDDASTAVGKRYDLKVSSVYKYPVPNEMTMHGDWPSSDAVTGFFYWEKEPNSATKYHFHVLWYGEGKPDEIELKPEYTLCNEQDGHNVTDYGYGAFSVGGSLDSAVTLTGGTSTDVTNTDVESAVKTALAAVEDLKITDPATVAVKLYNVTDVSSSGFVTANVGGNEYVFAPEFYAISAGKDADHVGTDADVFGVRSDLHLRKVGSHLSGSFVQSHDINYKDNTTGLTPIGDSANKFTGTYNGGSYRIINAKFNTTEGSDYAGLFGVTDGAQLENIVMFNEAATADEFDKNKIEGKNVGVIVGNAENAGTIENCVAAGYTVIGSENSGGIAGISACPITNCEANIRFGKVENVAGGIVGNGAEISSCYALVHGIESPSSDMDLGGIAGAASEVKNCYVIFSGQTVGYPVANVTVAGSNYYVNTDGYYQGSIARANIGTGVKMGNLPKTVPAEITYVVSATKSEDTNYKYNALFDDTVSSKNTHYGPVPEPHIVYGEFVNGPIVGVFNLRKYADDQYPPQYDGYISYNRSGKIYEGSINGGTGGRIVGVLFEEGKEPYEAGGELETIEIFVNNRPVKAIKKDLWLRASSYVFSTKFGDGDESMWSGSYGNLNANTRYDYYLLYDVDDEGNPTKLAQLTDDSIIRVRYTMPNSKKGLLIEAKGPLFKVEMPENDIYGKVDSSNPLQTDDIAIFRTETYYDGNVELGTKQFPEIFWSNGNPKDPMDVRTEKVGGGNGRYETCSVGIMIKDSRIPDLMSGDIRILLSNNYIEPDKLEKWDESKHGELYCADRLTKWTPPEGYTMYVAASGYLTPRDVYKKNYNGETQNVWGCYGDLNPFLYFDEIARDFRIDVMYGSELFVSESGQHLAQMYEDVNSRKKEVNEYHPAVGIYRLVNSNGYKLSYKFKAIDETGVKDNTMSNGEKTNTYGIMMRIDDDVNVYGISVTVDGVEKELRKIEFAPAQGGKQNQLADPNYTSIGYYETVNYSYFEIKDPITNPSSEIIIYQSDDGGEKKQVFKATAGEF